MSFSGTTHRLHQTILGELIGVVFHLCYARKVLGNQLCNARGRNGRRGLFSKVVLVISSAKTNHPLPPKQLPSSTPILLELTAHHTLDICEIPPISMTIRFQVCNEEYHKDWVLFCPTFLSVKIPAFLSCVPWLKLTKMTKTD